MPPYVVPATDLFIFFFNPSAPEQFCEVQWRQGGLPGLHVPLHVQSQVVGPGERPVAQVALEGPVPRVLAVVPGELVRAGELPAAAFPVAVVGLLTCVRPEVSLQV